MLHIVSDNCYVRLDLFYFQLYIDFNIYGSGVKFSDCGYPRDLDSSFGSPG